MLELVSRHVIRKIQEIGLSSYSYLTDGPMLHYSYQWVEKMLKVNIQNIDKFNKVLFQCVYFSSLDKMIYCFHYEQQT